ncbi:hypothetical protein [Jeotgalibacillus malaysiensis]|uniref:hypothetical protein n=1 Tax=Jeotgalibacillus malaysiensis TaxID=1508404 RepID=UPI00384E0A10
MNLGNVLVFGGTGMLAEATGWIADHSVSTTAFGRDQRKLECLVNTYGVETEVLDYTDLNTLSEQIDTAYRTHGSIHLVVAWIHNTSPEAISVIQETIFKLQPARQWTLIIVKGSSSRQSDIAEE